MKPFYRSKTILGILVAAAPQILEVAGVQIAEQSSPEVSAIVTIAGLLLATYGRAKAADNLSVMPRKEP